jgi:hypothetical protein
MDTKYCNIDLPIMPTLQERTLCPVAGFFLAILWIGAVTKLRKPSFAPKYPFGLQHVQIFIVPNVIAPQIAHSHVHEPQAAVLQTRRARAHDGVTLQPRKPPGERREQAFDQGWTARRARFHRLAPQKLWREGRRRFNIGP